MTFPKYSKHPKSERSDFGRFHISSVFKNRTIFRSVCSDFGRWVVKTGLEPVKNRFGISSKPVLFGYQTFGINRMISYRAIFCSVCQTGRSFFGRSLYQDLEDTVNV